MIYSKLVSNTIEVFLCYLSLTDNTYYFIKDKLKEQNVKIFSILRCEENKLIIFLYLL